MSEHLMTPYGGTLIDGRVPHSELNALRARSRDWPSTTLTARELADVELLSNGGLSPLRGFMTHADWRAVKDGQQLTNGTFWPVPIVLQVDDATARLAERCSWLALRDEEGVMVAVVEVTDLWKIDGNATMTCVAGPVSATVDYFHYDFRPLRLTPRDTRQMFDRIGWRRVLAFHSNGAIHRAEHASMMRVARQHKVNLLLHALVGATDTQSSAHYTTVRALRAAIDRFPRNTSRLALLVNPDRGGVDAQSQLALRAIVARNYGCSHIAWTNGLSLAGRCGDTAPLPPQLERIRAAVGVEPVPASPMVWVENEAAFVPSAEVPATATSRALSAAELRQRLDEDRPLPSWFTFDDVARELRRGHRPKHRQGFTVFFTGLSGAGKSTVANVLRVKLMELGDRPVTLLDGDIVRRHLSSELGFSREHRDINIRRIGFVASEITKNGGIAICAPIAPYDSVRREVRTMVERGGGFVLVHVATPLSVCEQRDRKGLYAKARAGLIQEFTGVSDPYEAPDDADLALDTSELSPAEATQAIVLHLTQQGYLGNPPE